MENSKKVNKEKITSNEVNKEKTKLISKTKSPLETLSEATKNYQALKKLTQSSFPDNLHRLLYPSFYQTFDYSNYPNLGSENFSKLNEINEEINQLRKKLLNKSQELDTVSYDKRKQQKSIEELKLLLDELSNKEKIKHISSRIHIEARNLIFADPSFKKKFEDGQSSETVVVSIDIRRSTELMLKARTPELFANFITNLSSKLAQVIIDNFGIFDKFTGDGILAFFPKFYSGEEAILRALIAAEQCHKVFDLHYNNSRNCFNAFIKDIGLGIGIDYGHVTLVNTGNELTVVGIPVVYACRMSSAPAGHTLLNQPAKEEICKNYEDKIHIIETEINIKNEGVALAYEIELPIGLKKINQPEWLTISKSEINV